jgi:hypothetical protein
LRMSIANNVEARVFISGELHAFDDPLRSCSFVPHTSCGSGSTQTLVVIQTLAVF